MSLASGRAAEIRDWLEMQSESEQRAWVAIDDLPLEEQPGMKERAVRTSIASALTWREVERAAEILLGQLRLSLSKFPNP